MQSQPNNIHSNSQLGRKLVVMILLVNALLSIVTASAQLYLGYQRDKARVISSIGVIENSFRVSFENALWEYNFGLIEALMDGVFNRADVGYVKLDSGAEQFWERGENIQQDLILNNLRLTHTGKNGKVFPLGNITIGLSLADVTQRVWAQFWTLMLSNFVKTVIASFIMLALFNFFISRHLKVIAQYVDQHRWLESGKPLSLARKPLKAPDDLDHIVTAINEVKQKSFTDYQALKAEVEQRQLAEQALVEKANSLEQANKEQAEFTYAISHDLKSPTNTVAMILEQLEGSQGTVIESDGKQLIDLAQSTIVRMGKLVEDVLLYSRAIGEELTLETVDLNKLIKKIISDLQSDIQHHRATIEFDDLPLVLGNPLLLRMVFQNLITNAMKFKKAEATPVITFQSKPVDHSCMAISVSDNGIGIDPKYHKKIFGLFQRLHTHKEYAGTGIGLTLCQRVVTNHGGKIQVESAIDRGTTFTVTLKAGYGA